jgi:hypothetical protein
MEKYNDNYFKDYFENIEKRFECELFQKINQSLNILNITNIHQENVLIKQFEYIKNCFNATNEINILIESNRHIEELKKIEVQLKKMDYDIEMKKIEYETLKITKS